MSISAFVSTNVEKEWRECGEKVEKQGSNNFGDN